MIEHELASFEQKGDEGLLWLGELPHCFPQIRLAPLRNRRSNKRLSSSGTDGTVPRVTTMRALLQYLTFYAIRSHHP
jgi:hypothetical protein